MIPGDTPRIGWTMGIWMFDPWAGTEAGEARARALRKAARVSHVDPRDAVNLTMAVPGMDAWEGRALHLLQTGPTAPSWAFFQCTDRARELAAVQHGLPNTGFVVAAWCHDRPPQRSTLAQVQAIRAELVVGGKAQPLDDLYDGMEPWVRHCLAMADYQVPAQEWALARLGRQVAVALEASEPGRAWRRGAAAIALGQRLPGGQATRATPRL